MEGFASLGTLDPQHAVAQICQSRIGLGLLHCWPATRRLPASLECASITPLRAGCQGDRRKAADAPPVRR
jgi:hypothetical protein